MATPLVQRAGVLGGLYLVQGLVFGTGALVLVPQLAAAGVDLEHQAGLLALAGVPWVFKLAWGPVVDAPRARRAGAGRIAAVAMAAMAACLLAIAAVPEPAAAVRTIAVLWLLANAATSLQDVATDALAFDLLAPTERARGLAVMLAGHHVGAEALAGAWIGSVAAGRGLAAGLVLVALVLVAMAIAALGLPRTVATPRAAIAPAVRALLADRTATWAVATCAFVLAADVATSAVTGELLVVRLGWSPEQIAARIPMPLLLGSLAGFASASAVLDRLGHVRCAQSMSIALAGCWLAFALAEPLWSQPTFVQGFVVIQAVVTAWLYASIHVVLMDLLHVELRATQFAVLTALLNLPRLWAPLVASSLVARVGLVGLFVAAAAWQAALALPLGRLGRARAPAAPT